MLGVLQTVPSVPSYSTLPLDLIGVIVNKDAASPIPSFSPLSLSLEEEVFQPGQIAFDFAEIMEIRRDGVLLRNRMTNNPEYLTFEKNNPWKNL